MNIKLTYELNGKTASIEQAIDTTDEREAHEATHRLMLQWFRGPAFAELNESDERVKTNNRKALKRSILQSARGPYDQVKFLEDEDLTPVEIPKPEPKAQPQTEDE